MDLRRRALTNIFALDFFILDGAGQIEPVEARGRVIGRGIGFGEDGAHGAERGRDKMSGMPKARRTGGSTEDARDKP